MTAVNTVFLIIGMAVLGVPLILGLLSPIVGAVVVRLFPESAWDGAMLFFAQAGAATATFMVGKLAVGLPWGACLIAAVLVGITSYARRDPDSLSSDGVSYSDDDELYAYDSDSRDSSPDADDFDRTKEICPQCGKRCRGAEALSQHTKAKHPDTAHPGDLGA